VEVQLKTLLTWTLDRGEWSASRPGRFTPGETDPGTHLIGFWLDSRAGLDAMQKRKNPCLCRESNPGRPARNLVTILTELQWSGHVHCWTVRIKTLRYADRLLCLVCYLTVTCPGHKAAGLQLC